MKTIRETSMPQTILLTGTILASSIGFALIGLLLRSAIRSDWQHSVRKPCHRGRSHDDSNRCAANSLKEAVRGYDTPELYREDFLARTDRSERRSLH
jgi:hypothetical protein